MTSTGIRSPEFRQLPTQPLGYVYVVRQGLARSHIADELNKRKEVYVPKDIEDARERIQALIVARRGPQKFRNRLLTLYQGKCAITGTLAQDMLEAAHILPYNGPETNKPRNGLLLRSDMHALFDLKLIAVDTRTMTLLVSGGLKSTEYADYAGRSLNLPRIEQLAMREVVEYTAARGWSLDPQAMCATRPACGQSQG